MADFQVPQYQNPNVQFQGAPADLINSLYNRQKPGEIAAQNINQGVENLLNTYYKQKQLQAQAFEAGGPYLMNMLYGGSKSTTPPGQVAGQMPQAQGVPQQSSNVTPPVAGTPGGTTPGNYGASPQTTAQTMPGGMPSIQGSTQPAIPETIQATLNHPTLGIHAQKILDLQQQMGQNAQMGKYGQTLNTGLKDQLSAEQALMQGEQFQQGQARQQKQFEEGQAAEEYRFQRSEQNKIKGQVAGEVSKRAQKMTATDTAKSLLDTFVGKFLRKGPNGVVDLTNASPTIPGIASAGTKVAELTGGRYGNIAGKDMVENSRPLANALVSLLTQNGRLNPSVATDIVNGIIPGADEPTPKKIEKIRDMKKLIGVIESGDQRGLDDFISTVQGRQLGRS